MSSKTYQDGGAWEWYDSELKNLYPGKGASMGRKYREVFPMNLMISGRGPQSKRMNEIDIVVIR